MRKLYISLLILCGQFCLAQVKQLNYSDQISLAKNNLVLLDKRNALSSYYRLEQHGIRIDIGKPTEQFIPESRLNTVVNLLEFFDLNQLSKLYSDKTLSNYGGPVGMKQYKEVPTSIEGLEIAIDPGHFAGDLRTAIQEEKYVKIKGSDLGLKKDVVFYEAELNDLTAMLVEVKLLALGAKPFRTKQRGVSALGKPFKKWMEEDFRKDLETSYLIKHEITKKDAEDLAKFSNDSVFILQKFYKNLDLRRRSALINQQEPDITICIHYNSKEGARRDASGYLQPVNENYSMAFVPGAFLPGELNRASERVDFLRLLMSPDIDKSMRLANQILIAQQELTGIPPVAHDQHKLDEQVCTPSEYNGVYLRNLALTRLARGPMVYLEALLQDSQNMAPLLAVKDYEFTHPEFGKMTAPKICERVAEGIVAGIRGWVEENKKYAAQNAK